MKRRSCLLMVLIAAIAGCGKKYPEYNQGKTILYHIEGNDTISWVAIPNSLTPDSDGINDHFTIYSDCIIQTGFSLTIFKRNNEAVFYSEKLFPGWDGTHKGTYAPSDEYTWHLVVSDTTGYWFDHLGIVHLIR